MPFDRVVELSRLCLNFFWYYFNKWCVSGFHLYRFQSVIVVFVVLFLGACTSTPPKHTDNICHIFDEKRGWYKDAKKAYKRWGISIPVAMAFMHQESRFIAKARPPRSKILGFIPGPRKSSAYGYSQAKDETWDWYKKSASRMGADRNDFDDAIDFIAWYNHTSHQKLGIAKGDTRNLYLAYHEGHGGYTQGSYKRKSWLVATANKVNSRAKAYTTQLAKCESRLSSSWWPF